MQRLPRGLRLHRLDRTNVFACGQVSVLLHPVAEIAVRDRYFATRTALRAEPEGALFSASFWLVRRRAKASGLRRKSAASSVAEPG